MSHLISESLWCAFGLAIVAPFYGWLVAGLIV